MKIVAGLGCIDDYPLFCEAGADEFFCGYVPYTWTKRYGTTLALNPPGSALLSGAAGRLQ